MQNNNPLKLRLKEAMENRGVKVPALAKQTGIPKDRIYAWYRDNTDPKIRDAERLEKWLTGEKPSVNGDNGQPKALAAEVSNLEPADNGTLLRILDNLSAAHREISESNNKLADNEKLILMQMPTVDSAKDNGVASPKVMSGILVAMAKIASGTRWHSEEEAIRELGRLLSPQVDESKKIKDSRVG